DDKGNDRQRLAQPRLELRQHSHRRRSAAPVVTTAPPAPAPIVSNDRRPHRPHRQHESAAPASARHRQQRSPARSRPHRQRDRPPAHAAHRHHGHHRRHRVRVRNRLSWPHPCVSAAATAIKSASWTPSTVQAGLPSKVGQSHCARAPLKNSRNEARAVSARASGAAGLKASKKNFSASRAGSKEGGPTCASVAPCVFRACRRVVLLQAKLVQLIVRYGRLAKHSYGYWRRKHFRHRKLRLKAKAQQIEATFPAFCFKCRRGCDKIRKLLSRIKRAEKRIQSMLKKLKRQEGRPKKEEKQPASPESGTLAVGSSGASWPTCGRADEWSSANLNCATRLSLLIGKLEQ
uniref:60S ribosomal protein L36 n=1 Tax=Macrostomum lignano TaxID=282301 RepID=A0A1I8F1Z8_9PLAT